MSSVRFELVMRTEVALISGDWTDEEVLSVFKETIVWEDKEELCNNAEDNSGWHLTKIKDKVYLDYPLYMTDDVESVHYELVMEAVPSQQMFDEKFGRVINLLEIYRAKFLMVSFDTGGCAGYVEID